MTKAGILRRGRGFLDEERGALTTEDMFRSVARVIGNFLYLGQLLW